jgi:hypothetical protein
VEGNNEVVLNLPHVHPEIGRYPDLIEDTILPKDVPT